jgi:hypothetical protein
VAVEGSDGATDRRRPRRRALMRGGHRDRGGAPRMLTRPGQTWHDSAPERA